MSISQPEKKLKTARGIYPEQPEKQCEGEGCTNMFRPDGPWGGRRCSECKKNKVPYKVSVKPTKLTKDNYYTNKNRYLSNSKMGDWLKDKRYFFEKHVQGTTKNKKTDSLVIGDAVDTWLTQSEDAFRRKFAVVDRRSAKNPPSDYTEITQTMYDQIVGICQSVERQDAYKFIKRNKYKAQKILSYHMPLGLFEGLCGKPDWYKVTSDSVDIIDLKTTSNIDPKAYFFSCQDYGYFRQQAFYQILLSRIEGVTKFTSRHLAVEKDPDGIYKVQTFILDQEIIDAEKIFIWETLKEIAKERDFKPSNVGWKSEIKLSIKPDKKYIQSMLPSPFI